VLAPADLPEVDPELLRPVRRQARADRPAGSRRATAIGPQVGFAGVGKPWKVERALEAAGCDLADFVPLPDHTTYDARPCACWPSG